MDWKTDILDQLRKRDSPIGDYKIIMEHLAQVQDKLVEARIQNETLKSEKKAILELSKNSGGKTAEMASQMELKEKDEKIMELTHELKEHYKQEYTVNRRERQLRDEIDKLQESLIVQEKKLATLSDVEKERQFLQLQFDNQVTELIQLKDELLGLTIELSVAQRLIEPQQRVFDQG